MYSFSSSGYSDEGSPYLVPPRAPSSSPRLAGSQPFRDAMQSEQKRRADLIGGVVDSKAQVQAAKYGAMPTQPSRQPSIGDQIAAGLAKPLGTLAGGLVGGLFGGGTSPSAPLSTTGFNLGSTADWSSNWLNNINYSGAGTSGLPWQF